MSYITRNSLRNNTAGNLRDIENRSSISGTNHHESESDDMAQVSVLFSPQTYSGTRNEAAVEWIESVRHWIKFKAFSEAQSCAAFPLLLRDGASGWYRGLTDAIKNDFERLTQAFIERYGTNAVTGWQDTAAVWTMKQGPQSVEDYLDAVEKRASRTNMSEEQKCHAMINGLRGSIRQQVLNHEGLDKQTIRKWALIAEAGEATSTEQSDVTSALKSLQQQLSRLELRTLASPGQNHEDQRRSVSPRVRFEDEDNRYSSRPQRLERTVYDNGEYHGREERTFHRRDERDYRRYDQPRPSQSFRPNTPPRYAPQYQTPGRRTPSPGPAPHHQASRNYNSRNRPSRAGYNTQASSRPIYGQGRENTGPEGNCHRCLGPRHPFSRCPAAQDRCGECSVYGHWSSACRNSNNQP